MKTKTDKIIVCVVSVIGLIFLCSMGVMLNSIWMIASTKKLVAKTATLFNEDEYFLETVRPSSDSWGNQLRININADGMNHICVVTSSGPDQKFDTEDDISAKEINYHPNAKKIGEDIGKSSGRFGIGLGKGLIEAVKEEIKGE